MVNFNPEMAPDAVEEQELPAQVVAPTTPAPTQEEIGGVMGISGRAEQMNTGSRGSNNELFLSAGDEAHVSIISSGAPNDIRVQDYETYRATGMGKNGAYQYDAVARAKNSANGPYEHPAVAEGAQLRNKFGIWLYVEGVLRNPANRARLEDSFGKEEVATWKATQSASGTKKYLVQPVGDYWMFTQGFGKGKATWLQIVDIFDTDGCLNKNKVKISRTGTGRDDTVYAIKLQTNTPTTIPEEINGRKAAELGYPVDFYLDKERSIAAAIAKRAAEGTETTTLTPTNDTPPWSVDETPGGTSTPSFDTPVSGSEESLTTESLF